MNAKRTLIAFALSCALGHAAELHWRNGEMIGGDFLAAEKDRVAWRNAQMFTEPLRVRLDVLKQVVRHKDKVQNHHHESPKRADARPT